MIKIMTLHNKYRCILRKPGTQRVYISIYGYLMVLYSSRHRRSIEIQLFDCNCCCRKSIHLRILGLCRNHLHLHHTCLFLYNRIHHLDTCLKIISVSFTIFCYQLSCISESSRTMIFDDELIS